MNPRIALADELRQRAIDFRKNASGADDRDPRVNNAIADILDDYANDLSSRSPPSTEGTRAAYWERVRQDSGIDRSEHEHVGDRQALREAAALVEGLKRYPTLGEDDPNGAKREVFIQGYIAAVVPPANETAGLRDALEKLLSVVDVYVADNGIMKGKMILAIGFKSAKHCWTPQNSYEHAVINTLGGSIRDARDALATVPQGQKMPKAGVYFDTWATNPVGSSAPQDAPAVATQAKQIADEICNDPRIFTFDWNHSLEGLRLVIEEKLASLPAAAREEGESDGVSRISDTVLAIWKEMARRDDWHMRFVGSDIRLMIQEIERLRPKFYRLFKEAHQGGLVQLPIRA